MIYVRDGEPYIIFKGKQVGKANFIRKDGLGATAVIEVEL